MQSIQNIACVHLEPYRYAERLAGILIEHCEHLVGAPVAELVVHEVNRPDVVGMRGPQPDDRAVFVIEPPSLLVTMGQL